MAEKVSRRRFIEYGVMGTLGAAVAGLGGYTAWQALQPTPTKEKITIGITLPLSGFLAADGELNLRTLDMATDMANAAGGVLGRPVVLKVYDDGYDLAKVTTLYEKLITVDKVDLVLSPYCTYLAHPAYAVAKKYNKPMFVICSGALPADQDPTFFVNPTIESGSKTGGYVDAFLRMFRDFSTWSTGEKPETIAMILMETPYGETIGANWPAEWSNIGIDTVLKESYDIFSTDFTPTITKIKALDPQPDILFMTAYFYSGVLFTTQLKDQGGYVKAHGNEGGIIRDWWLDTAKGGVTPAYGNYIMNYHGMPDGYHGGWSDLFRAEYKNRYGVHPGFTGISAISALELAVKATNLAGSLDSDDILKVLRENILDLTIGQFQLADGSNKKLEYAMGQWLDGDFHTVYPAKWKSKDPVYPIPTS